MDEDETHESEPMDEYTQSDPPVVKLRIITQELLSVVKGLRTGKIELTPEILSLAEMRLAFCLTELREMDNG